MERSHGTTPTHRFLKAYLLANLDSINEVREEGEEPPIQESEIHAFLPGYPHEGAEMYNAWDIADINRAVLLYDKRWVIDIGKVWTYLVLDVRLGNGNETYLVLTAAVEQRLDKVKKAAIDLENTLSEMYNVEIEVEAGEIAFAEEDGESETNLILDYLNHHGLDRMIESATQGEGITFGSHEEAEEVEYSLKWRERLISDLTDAMEEDPLDGDEEE